jgi:hypothetical protein
MDSMGDDLKKYIAEAKARKNKEPTEEKSKQKGESMIDPFVDIAKGFGEMAGALFSGKLTGGKAKKQELSVLDLPKGNSEVEKAKKDIQKILWLHYKIFKKVHRCITW